MRETDVSEKQEITLHFPHLPHYVRAVATIVKDEFEREGGGVSVTVYSDIHVPKETKMDMGWSYHFFRDRRNEFMSDVAGFMVKIYGLTLMPTRYW